MNDLQGAGQATPVVNISIFGEAPLSIAAWSPETLALSTITLSGSSLPKIGENDAVMVNISNVTTTKILNKRSSLGGVEYKCELWLPVDLVKEVQMGTRSRPELRERT